jgi:uncharacterized protein YbcV (DUF1398 family)
MFTIDDIKAAHAKVKSGTDFPAYIQDLIQLGVTNYETYTVNGNTIFSGENNFNIESGAKYTVLEIAAATDPDTFRDDLKATQTGKTDYLQFCRDCAKSGVSKWQVSTSEMTCTYFGINGNKILTETIPSQGTGNLTRK